MIEVWMTTESHPQNCSTEKEEARLHLYRKFICWAICYMYCKFKKIYIWISFIMINFRISIFILCSLTCVNIWHLHAYITQQHDSLVNWWKSFVVIKNTSEPSMSPARSDNHTSRKKKITLTGASHITGRFRTVRDCCHGMDHIPI